MRLISLLFIILFTSLSYGNKILFLNKSDLTFQSYSWACQILNFNYKNSCLEHSNYIRRPVKVGFLDTGFNSSLPIFRSYNIGSGYNVSDNKLPITDYTGHGTQTVSVFIDTINRIESIIGEPILFDLTPVKVEDENREVNSFNLLKGYFYLGHFMEVDLINLSLSGLDYSSDEAKGFVYGEKKFKSLVITAAGNEVYNLDKVNSYPCSYQSSNLLCVGSVNKKGNGLVSNFGYDVGVLINGEKVRVVQAQGNYNAVTGSSFSAPQITAYATYALYKNPNLTPDQLKDMMIESSYDKSLCLFSKSCGVFDFYKFKRLVDQSL